MELREALTQITEIRLQMARTEVFRGYRAVPAAFSGLVALLASAVQSLTVQDPVQQINAYLGLWIGAALISGMSAVLEMGVRAECDLAADSRADLPGDGAVLSLPGGGSTGDDGRGPFRAGERLDLAWPLAGALQPGHLRLPPASTPVNVRRGGLLPDDGVGDAGSDARPARFNPWAMGLPFCVGQLLAAAVLYQTLERDHDAA